MTRARIEVVPHKFGEWEFLYTRLPGYYVKAGKRTRIRKWSGVDDSLGGCLYMAAIDAATYRVPWTVEMPREIHLPDLEIRTTYIIADKHNVRKVKP